ncbi:hypothetical protein [Flammeovirga kamogawensis]|uniref:VOC family protein n=1 Tax=Flammeovirga kamogawensis TaxID=373891 RepID=A0ABX8H2L5_9BACT|nr:hypothetical protein [Flammeovirga kamogawensis]MBB6463304.1 hypothetical protein [Flammeovirga kamogawensis]QWG09547.1 hypothetical protein KM029_23350 [Flammeovirga kamogawensis]TRX65061.1 hypothetical protein EO216_21245 [Flammeovirga kamogawensis]
MIVQTTISNIEATLSFYKKLNFEVLNLGEKYVFLSNSVQLQAVTKKSSRKGIVLYKGDIGLDVQPLIESSIHSQTETETIIMSPSGALVYLLEGNAPLLNKVDVTPLVGTFVGISLESLDLNKSMTFWEQLGFKMAMGDALQGWVSLSNATGDIISVMRAGMCPHQFSNPSLTFFNGDNNLEVIDKVRAANLTIKEEITQFSKEGIVDNIVLEDPDGFGFFVFND